MLLEDHQGGSQRCHAHPGEEEEKRKPCSRRQGADRHIIWSPAARGRIIPGRSLLNPCFKTSKDGGSLHKPPGLGFFGGFFFALSCFSYLGNFLLLFNLNISCSCLHQGGFVPFTWIFSPFLQPFPHTKIAAVPLRSLL